MISVGAWCAFMAVRAVLSPWRRGPLSGCVSGLLVAVGPLGERGHWGTWASVAAGCGLSTRRGQDLGHRFHQRGLRASWLYSMWDLPGPGMKPRVSCVGAGLFTMEPPGKPQSQTQDGCLDVPVSERSGPEKGHNPDVLSMGSLRPGGATQTPIREEGEDVPFRKGMM